MGSSPPVDLPTARPAALVRALHSFEPTTAGAAATGGSCLSFEAGQLIRCLNKDPSGWWDGQVILSHDGPNGHEQLGERGWFPSNYVEELADEMSGSRVSRLIFYILLCCSSADACCRRNSRDPSLQPRAARRPAPEMLLHLLPRLSPLWNFHQML